MEENSDDKAGPAVLTRAHRLSVESENVSSPATPTKKKAARVAAKPLLDNIKENTPVNSPKPTRRRSTARDLDDEKPVTPSRRSTRIRSNTSLVLENVMQSVQADSPRAKRAARRNSLAGSDSEAPSTPVKTTRRTRKDSTSSIENNEPVASKPIIEETIAEEPENQIESLSPSIASDGTQPSRKSPRLARRSKKSGEFAKDDDKNVSPKQSPKLNNSKSDSKKNRGKQSKTPETEKPDGQKNTDIVITDSTKDTPKRQRTKSWTTITNDRVEPVKMDKSLNATDHIDGNGDFLDKDAKEAASIELLQDIAPKNIQCDVYIEDSSSNGDVNKIYDINKEFDTQDTNKDSFVTSSSQGFFKINVSTQNLGCVPMDIDETVLDDNDTIDQQPTLNISEFKITDSDSQSIFDINTSNSLNKSKNRKSSINKTLDQLNSEDNIVLQESHTDKSNQSLSTYLNKSKNRKSSLSKTLNESLDQSDSKDNLIINESHKTNDSLNKSKNRKSRQATTDSDSQSISDTNTNKPLSKSKNRKSSLSKSINVSLDQWASEDNLILKASQIDNANQSLNKSKNRKSSLSKSINGSIDQLASEDNLILNEQQNDNANQSLNKSKNRNSSLSKSINGSIEQLASEDNLILNEQQNENANQSLNKSKNRNSSLSKATNESIDQLAPEDNPEIKESHTNITNQSLNKSKNQKLSLSKSINESLDQLASEDNIVINESQNDKSNQSLNKSKNGKSSLSKSINGSLDQLASEDNIENKDSHNDKTNQLDKSRNRKSTQPTTDSDSQSISDTNTNKSLNKSKNRKSSLSKSIDEITESQKTNNYLNESKSRKTAQPETGSHSQSTNTNTSLNKSKNRKSSLLKSVNDSLEQSDSEDNVVLKKSQNESTLNVTKSKKNSSMSVVQELKQKTNETSSFKVNDDTNFGEYTDNKTFNNAKSNISFDETDSNVSLSKKSKKKLKVPTLILSKVDDSANDHSINKSQKSSFNTSSMLDHNKKRNLSDIQDNTPLRNKNVKGLGIQTSTPVVADQKGSKSKKPDVSEIQESRSSDSESDESEAADDDSSADDNDSSERIKKSMFFDDEAEDAEEDYQSGDSNSDEDEDVSVEEEEDSEEEGDDTESEESSDDEKNISLQPNNQVLKGSQRKKPRVGKIEESNSSDSDSEDEKHSDSEKNISLDPTNQVLKGSQSKKPKVGKIEENSSSDSDTEDEEHSENAKNISLNPTNQVLKGSQSKKPKVGKIEESSSSDSDTEDKEHSENAKNISLKPTNQVLKASQSKKPKVGKFEESSSSDSDTEDEEHSENARNISLKPINQVHVDENISMSRLEATSDPLHDNDEDSASLCSENEEIVKGYDSVLDNLNKSGHKNIKQHNLSLNAVQKSYSKGNNLIDQLNLTQTKNRKSVNENTDKVNEDNKMQVIKAPSGNRDSDSSSLDMQLLFSDSNSGDDKDSQDYIPLKRSFGATNLHDEPETSTVLNTSTKKIVTSIGEANKMSIPAAREPHEKENHNVTNITKKNKKVSESKLPTPLKVTNDKKIEDQAQSSSVNQTTTVVGKSKKRKRVSEPQEETENKEEQTIAEKVNSKKPKYNASIEEPQPRRSKRKAIDDNELGNNNKKLKLLKENRLDNIHIPRLAPAVLQQLEGTSEIKSASAIKSKAVATSSFVIEETAKRQIKPSHYLEQSIHLDTDSPDKIIPKKRAPLPKVLPFVPTAVTSSQGFTTRFQISVLPKETKFTAQTSNTKNFKNDYLFGKNIKRMGTYALYKKNRNNKLSKF